MAPSQACLVRSTWNDGALGVVAGMVFLGFVLRKMDGLLEKSVAPHVLVWAAMLLATVWMGILGNVE